MLNELVDCIENLRERITIHGALLRENETRTRLQLVDPLLLSLGWDVSDPGLVIPEYAISGKWADYALLQPDGKAAAVIEAKKLGESLDSHRMQMLNYANAAGIEYTGLTDGNHWELYSVFQKGTLEERRILDISVNAAPVQMVALKLLLLWRPNLESSNAISASQPILVDLNNASPTPKTDASGSNPGKESEHPTFNGTKEISPSVTEVRSKDWIPLSDYDPKAGTKSPVAIGFWDSSELEVKHWYEVLTITVEKLYKDGLLKVEHTPIGWSSKSYSVHSHPKHPTGNPFIYYRKINDSPLFVNINLNAGQVRKSARNILEKYGMDPAKVALKVVH